VSAAAQTAVKAPSQTWVLAGYKAGDNAQLMALVHALGWPFEVKHLAYRRTELTTNLLLRVTLAGVVKSRSFPLAPPWPELVLTAGRRNEPVARWIKAKSGGRTRLVHLGRPWAPVERFDLVITTPQYFVPEARNVLTIGMPLHGITPEVLQSAASQWEPRLAHFPRPRIAVLVGGSSPPYRFGVKEAAELGRLLEAKAAATKGSLLVTTSARTDRRAATALQAELCGPHWVHRWQHEREFLWRFHAVHHSSPRLYWLNGTRNHPLDLGLTYIVGYLPLVALGASEVVIMLFTLFDPLLGLLQHANIAMRLGPLNYVFSAAEPHRWHHSRGLNEANSNYGSNLLVWDLVFGTFFLPPNRAPDSIGIGSMPDFPQTFAAQMAAPFRWRRLKRRALLAS